MRTLRTDKRLQRWLHVSLGGKLKAVTVDVSELGFCAELAPVFLPGSEVDGEIRVRDRSFPFKGTVSWAKPGSRTKSEPSRIGVAFRQIPGEFASYLYGSLLAANA